MSYLFKLTFTDGVERRQWMIAMQIDGHFRFHLQPCHGNIRRQRGLRPDHAKVNASGLQQIQHIAILCNHALQLNLRVARVKLLEQMFVMIGLPEVGNGKT